MDSRTEGGMSTQGLHIEIKNLSTDDKLDLIEALWRSIAPEHLQAQPFDRNDLDELEGRAQRLRAAPASGVRLEDLDDFLNEP
jgi:putative addiction module component (TIGR02574 family)